MGSYLNIYLQKKKKEREEKGERLLLCSISRADSIYNLFYDNNICTSMEDRFHKFTYHDLETVIHVIDCRISEILLEIATTKQNLPLVSDKDAVLEIFDQLSTNENIVRDLMKEKVILESLATLFGDISEDWCDFDGLYWSIE